MIPQEKIEAVARGLREAFGVTEFEDISRIIGGHTASLVFRIIVRGSPYLLKIITRTEDPTRHYQSMRTAADAGVAPRVWYTGIEDRISITDFVMAETLPVSTALIRLPALLRTLHALPPFARAPFNTTCTFLLHQGPALEIGPSAAGFPQTFQASNTLPKAEGGEFFSRYAELAAVYPYEDAEMVSSHNDLFKPDNILYDGRRVWLVDWEAAFLNDRYADLAVAANHVVTNEEEETVFLREYFGAAPHPYQQARFYLMRQIAHLFYAMAYLTLGSSAQPVDWTVPVPGFRDFHSRMWAGEVDLTDRNVKIVYGRVHWEQFRRNVREARYKDALSIVSMGQTAGRGRVPDVKI